jgi:hypothetical protein
LNNPSAALFAHCAEEAISQRQAQVEVFESFAAALPVSFRQWVTQQVKEWEDDHTAFNPYSLADGSESFFIVNFPLLIFLLKLSMNRP